MDERELGVILAELPTPPPTADASRAAWNRWQVGLTTPITLPGQLPPLRVLLVLDNLAGHKTPAFVLWLFAHGVMPLYTPVSGSWLNIAESIQRVLKRRALDGDIRPTPAKSSDGSSRSRHIGIGTRRRSCEAASGPLGGSGNGSGGTLWAGWEHAPDDRSGDVMATGEASDPLGAARVRRWHYPRTSHAKPRRETRATG